MRRAALAALLAPLCAAAAPQGTGIAHVVFIIQENRSFDNYFGTFPGADGIPPGVCEPRNKKRPQEGCVAPFRDLLDADAGANHYDWNARADIDDGVTTATMRGFAATQINVGGQGTTCNGTTALLPVCWVERAAHDRVDVMGTHTDQEIPNYWAYARAFRLHDAMFSNVRAYSYPSHLGMVSLWSATCASGTDSQSCVTNTNPPPAKQTDSLPWASLFELLDAAHVGWRYYRGGDAEPDCLPDAYTCAPAPLVKPGNFIDEASILWNPAPLFTYVKTQGPAYLAAHTGGRNDFLRDLKAGTLPAVSWIVPSQDQSEHPPFGLTVGMNATTALINAVMQSPYWNDTAIFLTWDEWGGFYDHVVPPTLEDPPGRAYGYGLRVPAITIAAHVRPGIDHGAYSFDSYARFVEDVFVAGARLDPAGLGRPDKRRWLTDRVTAAPRPDGTVVRFADLRDAFDPASPAIPPLILPTIIPGGLLAQCSDAYSPTCTNRTVSLSWQGPARMPSGVVWHITRDGVEVPACAGTATRCTDTPPSGRHLYRGYAVRGTLVTQPSAAAEIVMP